MAATTAPTLRVYSGRHYDVELAFEQFSEETGVDVEFLTGNDAELRERIAAEGEDTEADVYLTVDAGNLAAAAADGLFQPLDVRGPDDAIPAEYRDPDNLWFGLALRARTIVYNTERMTEDEVPTTYEELADPAWKGRLCLRNSIERLPAVAGGQHHRRRRRGGRRSRSCEGWAGNADIFANDVELLEAIAAGACDVGVANHYYLARELEEDPDFPVGLVWAEQDGRGVHVNISGGGVTTYADNPDLAQQFLEWLATDGQDVFVASNHEYPANPAVAARAADHRALRRRLRARHASNADGVRRAQRRCRAADGRGGLRLTSGGGDERAANEQRHGATPASGVRRARPVLRTVGRAPMTAIGLRAGDQPPGRGRPRPDRPLRLDGRGRGGGDRRRRPDRDARGEHPHARAPTCGASSGRPACPGEIVSTIVLVVGVGTLSIVLGVGLAWLVSAHRFPGRRVLRLGARCCRWPCPATSSASSRRPCSAWPGRCSRGGGTGSAPTPGSPRSARCPGAIVTLSLTLYPYVYLLARAALRDQAGGAYAVARTLGASPGEAARRVVLPMLRPAVAAGAAVVVMETLTDFATVQYFNVDTVSVGVFRVWRGTYDRDAASELATLVLVFALLAIGLERVLRGRARFGQAGGEGAGIEPRRLRRLAGGRGDVRCTFAVAALGFGAPTAQLAVWAYREQTGPRGTPNLDRYLEFLGNSLTLTAFTVGICIVVAARRDERPPLRPSPRRSASPTG